MAACSAADEIESEKEDVDRGLRMVDIFHVVDGACDGMNRSTAIPICLRRLVQAILFRKTKEPTHKQIPSLLNEDESSRHLFPKLLIATLMEAASKSTDNSLYRKR